MRQLRACFSVCIAVFLFTVIAGCGNSEEKKQISADEQNTMSSEFDHLNPVDVVISPTTVTASQGESFTVTITATRQFMGVNTSIAFHPSSFGGAHVLAQPDIPGCNLTIIGSSCERTVTYTVLADAVPGMYIMEMVVSDIVSVQGASNLVPLTVTGTPRTLTVAKTGAGSGVITSSPAGIDCGAACSASFIAGTSITLTATAAAGSVFNSWTGAGGCFSNPCTFTLLDNTTPSTAPTARFDLAR